MPTKKKPEVRLWETSSYSKNNLYPLPEDITNQLKRICRDEEFERGFRELVTDLRASRQVRKSKFSEVRHFLARLKRESAVLLARLEEGIEPAVGNANGASTAVMILNASELVYRLREDLRNLLSDCDKARVESLPTLFRALDKDWSVAPRILRLMDLFSKFKIDITNTGNDDYDKGSDICLCIKLLYKAADKEISWSHTRNLLNEAKTIRLASSFETLTS